MTTVINKGYTDTPISGVTTLNFSRGLINFKVDYRVKTQASNGKEVVLTNLTSPLDRPETIRIASTDIANIYSGTSIEPSLFAPTKRGVSILTQITGTLLVTDTTDADYRLVLPLSAHLVHKLPVSEHVNASVVTELTGRLLSSLFDTGSTSESRLNSILRGSLVPSEL